MDIAGLIISILALLANILLWVVGLRSFKQSKRQNDNQVSSMKTNATAQIVQDHRSLFLELLKDDKLITILANGRPIDEYRREMVGTILINHCNEIFTYASKSLIEEDDWNGLQNDIADFFTWPVVKDRWIQIRIYYSVEFQEFIDNLTIKGRGTTTATVIK